ncbi:NRT1/PTR family protein 2.2 [Melia azedarach]|uniref:NRT1/PTR family protein 2.2 n=1 Tax=Melia azedarach TaxID=155640 RepID=A0ACC1XKN4_MELAZ|nr:NRT1/PTR family protein 2.2 [Melia azedarach]
MAAGEKKYSEEAGGPSTAEREESNNPAGTGKEVVSSSDSSKPPPKKKHRGWRAMPFILGNETFERLATLGLVANFMVYLMREFHMTQVTAANIINIWGGVSNFAPLLGAFISDAYTGRYKAIAFASFADILGMLTMTLIAWLPQLHPAKCNIATQFNKCKGPNKLQLGVLLMALGLLAVGTGGVRPCSIPFGIDQFDQTSEKGVKQIKSFINLYYTSFTVVLLITQTVLVYVQDSVSWVLGFGIPTLLMIGAIILFFVGTKMYVLVAPEGSIFTGIVQVCVAAFKKRRVKLPVETDNNTVFYDPPLKETVSSKLPLTNQLRFLNKAALMVDNEIKPDGTPVNAWRLGSIQQVEEVKCIIRIIPIFINGIITLIAMLQQSTFTISQAMKMDRNLGPDFKIPPGSMVAISYLTIVVWVPIYDRVLVPALRKVTKHEGGITVLQRCGIGIIFTILAMIAAGLVEVKRRDLANLHPQSLGNSPLSVLWLSPPLILLGFAEAFYHIGMLEFFNMQFPDNMKSIANALLYCSSAIASYVCSLMITIIHGTTGKHGRPDWLTNDINAGKLDYFYFLLAGIEVVNFFYFLYCASRYRYKANVQDEVKSYHDVELANSIAS